MKVGRNIHLLKITQVLSIIPFRLPLPARLVVSPFHKHQEGTETALFLPPWGLFSTGDNEQSALPASTVVPDAPQAFTLVSFHNSSVPNKLTRNFPVSIINGTSPSAAHLSSLCHLARHFLSSRTTLTLWLPGRTFLFYFTLTFW